MKAVFYVITGWVECHNYPYVDAIGWDGLRTLASFEGKWGEKLFEIESHSVTHRLVAEPERELELQIRHEFKQSKRDLNNQLKQDTRFFALPDGKYGQDDEISMLVRKIAKEEGYLGIRTSNKSLPVVRSTDCFRQTCRYVARKDHGLGYMRYILESPYKPPIINYCRGFKEIVKFKSRRYIWQN